MVLWWVCLSLLTEYFYKKPPHGNIGALSKRQLWDIIPRIEYVSHNIIQRLSTFNETSDKNNVFYPESLM